VGPRRVECVPLSPPAPLTRQTVAVSHAPSGRHRSPVPPRPSWHLGLLMSLVAMLTVGVFAAAMFLWPGDPSPRDQTPSVQPSISSSARDGYPSESAATVESTSTVTVTGDMIVVDEVSSVIDGDRARAVPSELTPLGLELVDTSVITPDGRSTSFEGPISISASGTLTVRSRYRLTDCPDVIPAQWPSPTDFPNATRSYLRLDGPLHTAYAICPKSRPAAKPLPDLSGKVLEGNSLRVRLTWLGPQTLIVKAIGSASGVAALVPNPDCDASCVASVSPGGSSEIQLEPVDPCPPATDSDRLTLVVQVGGATSTTSLSVKGLSKIVCA